MRNILFQASWADFEEYMSITIWEQNGRYFVRKRGHNVMIGSYNERNKITPEEALEIMMDYIEYEDDDYL